MPSVYDFYAIDPEIIGYYITAYGIAVKHGFSGTEEEWLKTLKGEQGTATEMRYNSDLDQIEWKLKTDSNWTGVLPLATIRGKAFTKAVEDIRKSTEEAANKATEATASASKAENERIGAEQAKTETDRLKGIAEQSAQQAGQHKAEVEQIKNHAATIKRETEALKTEADQIKQQTETIKNQAVIAMEQANTAKGIAEQSAQQAGQHRQGAEQAQGLADQAKTTAESWAVGGTGTRVGEDTNNAKYWSKVAEGAAGGGVSSFNGRSGAVVPMAEDYAAFFPKPPEIVDDLTTQDSARPISARQGVILKEMIDNIPKTPINNTLTSTSTNEALSAAQGKILNETKLTNKKRTLSVQDLNNANYPEPYVCSTDRGKQIGLPTDWAFIQYFRHENSDGYGVQVAYKLDRNYNEDNSKLWTMKIRVASGMTWGAWENVATSVPKGHYVVADLNACQEDGNHYYFGSGTLNKPPKQNDGIVSVYAYNAGTNEEQSKTPCLVQVSHSWWNENIFYRRGTDGNWGSWKELISNDNEVFSLGANGMTMKSHEKHINSRHIEGASTAGLDGALFLNYYNGKPVYFKDAGGGIQTLQGLFQFAGDGKTAIANAITGKGVPTSTTASWQIMAENIKKIGPKKKVIHITQFGDNMPQHCRVDWGRSGYGYSQGEYQTLLVLTPPNPIRLAVFEVLRGGRSERQVETLRFSGDYYEAEGVFFGDREAAADRFYGYCIPKKETMGYIYFAMTYNDSIQVNKLEAFQWLGVTSIKITYWE